MAEVVITFDYAVFIANPQFALFSNPLTYPEALLQAWWNSAINFISDTTSTNFSSCTCFTEDGQRLAIELLMAHLMYLQNLNAQGQVPGLMENATIDKVSVGLTPPPLPTQFRWWLSLSPYGQQLLALLQINSVGGQYIGGTSPRAGFRDGYAGWGNSPWFL